MPTEEPLVEPKYVFAMSTARRETIELEMLDEK
jgi:hypothetical protein